MTLEQLESEILKLPHDEFRKLADWVTERDQEQWDRKLGEDISAGRLGSFAEEAIREHQAGRTRRL